MKLRSFIFGLFAVLLAGCATAVRAQDGLLGVLSERSVPSHALVSLDQRVAAADFDNDQKPDGAVLLPAVPANGETSFRIELHLTAGRNNDLTFSSAETALSISALDVNNDGAPDIVIEKTLTHERIQVYLNDGHGSFHKARLESFLVPDPSAPLCRSWANSILQCVCLPSTRGDEVASVHTVSILASHRTRAPNAWANDPAAQSDPRLISPSRAPPSSL